MRIRITAPRSGKIDGVNLDVFHTGHTYEVDQSIASFLIVTGTAEPALEDQPALVVHGLGEEVLVSMAPESAPDMAAELTTEVDRDDGPA